MKWKLRLLVGFVVIFFLTYGSMWILARTSLEAIETVVLGNGVEYAMGYTSAVFWYDSNNPKAFAVKIDTVFDDSGVWKKIECCVLSKHGKMSGCAFSKESPECDERLAERQKTIKNYIKRLKKKWK